MHIKRTKLSYCFSYLERYITFNCKNKDELILTINLDYSAPFDSISTDYLTSFLTYLIFPRNIVNHFYKLSFRQFAVIKKNNSNPIPIQSGVSQGLSCSGDSFCLEILTIYLSINKSKII